MSTTSMDIDVPTRVWSSPMKQKPGEESTYAHQFVYSPIANPPTNSHSPIKGHTLTPHIRDEIKSKHAPTFQGKGAGETVYQNSFKGHSNPESLAYPTRVAFPRAKSPSHSESTYNRDFGERTPLCPRENESPSVQLSTPAVSAASTPVSLTALQTKPQGGDQKKPLHSPVPSASDGKYIGPTDHYIRGSTPQSTYGATHRGVSPTPQSTVHSVTKFREVHDSYFGPTDSGVRSGTGVSSYTDAHARKEGLKEGRRTDTIGVRRSRSPLPFGGNTGTSSYKDSFTPPSARPQPSEYPNFMSQFPSSRDRSPLHHGGRYESLQTTYGSAHRQKADRAPPSYSDSVVVSPSKTVSVPATVDDIPSAGVKYLSKRVIERSHSPMQADTTYTTMFNSPEERKPVSSVQAGVRVPYPHVERPAGKQSFTDGTSYNRDFTQPAQRSVLSSTTCELALTPGESSMATFVRGTRRVSSASPAPANPISPASLPPAGKRSRHDYPPKVATPTPKSTYQDTFH